jgi:hypothetical protein
MHYLHRNQRDPVVEAFRIVLYRLFWATLLVMAGIFITGCASNPVFREAREVPPAQLMQDCPAPSPIVTTNGELASYILSLKQVLRLCNDDKAALREWAAQP